MFCMLSSIEFLANLRSSPLSQISTPNVRFVLRSIVSISSPFLLIHQNTIRRLIYYLWIDCGAEPRLQSKCIEHKQ